MSKWMCWTKGGWRLLKTLIQIHNTITNTKYKGENWNFAVFITSCSSNRRPIQVRQPHRRPCKKVQESALLLWYQNKTGWKMKYSFVYLIARVITQRTNPARIASSVQPMALPLLKFSINTWRGGPTKNRVKTQHYKKQESQDGESTLANHHADAPSVEARCLSPCTNGFGAIFSRAARILQTSTIFFSSQFRNCDLRCITCHGWREPQGHRE